MFTHYHHHLHDCSPSSFFSSFVLSTLEKYFSLFTSYNSATKLKRLFTIFLCFSSYEIILVSTSEGGKIFKIFCSNYFSSLIFLSLSYHSFNSSPNDRYSRGNSMSSEHKLKSSRDSTRFFLFYFCFLFFFSSLLRSHVENTGRESATKLVFVRSLTFCWFIRHIHSILCDFTFSLLTLDIEGFSHFTFTYVKFVSCALSSHLTKILRNIFFSYPSTSWCSLHKFSYNSIREFSFPIFYSSSREWKNFIICFLSGKVEKQTTLRNLINFY